MLYKGAGYRRQELFVSIIDKILRAGEGRMLRKLDRLASQVDALVVEGNAAQARHIVRTVVAGHGVSPVDRCGKSALMG